jgi:hypothetical protein
MIRFICAQPSELYFVWQVEVMLNNFIEMGVDLQCVDIVCTKENNKIPEVWKKLSNAYNARFFFYEDTRITKHYTSSIRPNILKQHFKLHPNLKNETIFYHDCDIIFRVPINWNQFENDDIVYGSNTNWYISYDYIISKGNDVFDKMVEIMDITPQLVIDNNNNTIGAQYILKNIDDTFWENVERDCENLFKIITQLNNKKKKENPSYHELQIWAADMWSVLWNIWKCGYKTQVHPDLMFSWATSSGDFYNRYNIMHNAGVTNSHTNYFNKSNYKKLLPYNLNLKIKENTASKKYYEWVQKTEKKSVLLKNNTLI